MRALCTSFLSDFNLFSFVRTYSILFDVIFQFSEKKKKNGAYSNITITSTKNQFFFYYESVEAFLSANPPISKMELFVTLVSSAVHLISQRTPSYGVLDPILASYEFLLILDGILLAYY